MVTERMFGSKAAAGLCSAYSEKCLDFGQSTGPLTSTGYHITTAGATTTYYQRIMWLKAKGRSEEPQKRIGLAEPSDRGEAAFPKQRVSQEPHLIGPN